MAGALVGILFRALIFVGRPGEPYAAMMASFVYLAPVAVGAVTVYCAERIERRSWSYYFIASFLANVVFVLGTLLILIEGLICAILIVPLFAVLGGVGGVLMGLACRLTNWPKQTTFSIVLLPLVLGYFETHAPLPEQVRSVERSVLIDAPVRTVWNHIHFTPRVEPQDVQHAWIYRIGAPLPQSGITTETAQGPVRTVTMTKDVRFDQAFLEWSPPHRARWAYRFSAESFPPGALDEHVVIGGHYFDLQEGSFTLTPQGDGTELTMYVRYRLSTQFNWYAAPIARALLGNLEETVLDYYKRASEERK